MYLRKKSAQNIKKKPKNQNQNKTKNSVSWSLNLLPNHGKFCTVSCCPDTPHQHDLQDTDFLPPEMNVSPSQLSPNTFQ